MDQEAQQRVLVAHRRVDRARTLAAALRQAGYAVHTARSGERAFAAAIACKPHVVVLDCELRDPDAAEICREVKLGAPAPMVLLLAGSSRCEQGAADTMLLHPARPHTVVSQVRLLLELAAARRDGAATAAAAQARLRDQALFLAAAAHDLRQPAHAVRLFLSALDPRIDGDAERILLAHAMEGLDSLERLLSTLMDVSALNSGKLLPNLEVLDLAEMAEAVAVVHAPEAARKRLSLRVRAEPVTVRSDRVLLERILRNLVVNALRYTETGGVLLASRRRNGHAVLEVWDTGIGIPPEQRGRIFEAFHQVDGDGGGMGLGLAVVARTARLLGHEVAVDSRVGRGSVFRLKLPVAAAEALTPTACAACRP